MTDHPLDYRGRRLVRLLVLIVALVTLLMVAISGYWAVALDGGTMGAVLAAVWAVGGVVVIGATLRGVAIIR